MDSPDPPVGADMNVKPVARRLGHRQRVDLRGARREVRGEERGQIRRQLLEAGVRGRVGLRLIAVETAGAVVRDDRGHEPDHQRRDQHQHHHR